MQHRSKRGPGRGERGRAPTCEPDVRASSHLRPSADDWTRLGGTVSADECVVCTNDTVHTNEDWTALFNERTGANGAFPDTPCCCAQVDCDAARKRHGAGHLAQPLHPDPRVAQFQLKAMGVQNDRGNSQRQGNSLMSHVLGHSARTSRKGLWIALIHYRSEDRVTLTTDTAVLRHKSHPLLEYRHWNRASPARGPCPARQMSGKDGVDKSPLFDGGENYSPAEVAALAVRAR